MVRRLAPIVLLALAACATPQRLALRRSPLTEAPQGLLTPEGRASPIPNAGSAMATSRSTVDGPALAANARGYLGKRSISYQGKFPDDCTGLVRAVYASKGVDLFSDGAVQGDANGVSAIWRFTQRHGRLHKDRPAPGDIVFFSETYDRNRDGRDNDGLTHVGVVDSVDQDGTVHVIHRVASGVVSYRMNLDHPKDRADRQGRVLNDWLREGKKSRLAGELFAGYGTVAKP